MAAPVDAVLALASGGPLVVLGALLLATRRARPGETFFAVFAALWGAQVILANLGRVLESPALHDRVFPLSLALVPPAALFLLHFVARELPRPWSTRASGAAAAVAVAATGVLLLAPSLVVTTGPTDFTTVLGPAAVPLFVLPFFGAFFLGLGVFYRAFLRAPGDAERHRARGFLQALALFAVYAAARQASVYLSPSATVPGAGDAALLAAFFLAGGLFVVLVAADLVRRGVRDLGLLGAFLLPLGWALAEAVLAPTANVDSSGLWRLAAVTMLVVHLQQSDLVQALAAVRRSEERHRAIVGALVEGYFETDAEGRVLEANDVLARLLGRPLAQVRGAAFADHFRAEAGPAVAQAFDRARQTGGSASFEARAGRAGQREVEVVVARVDGSTPEGVAFRGFVRDLSERRRAEAERRRAEEQRREVARLTEQHRQKAQFVNTAAHELRTPLTPLRLQIESLGRVGDLSPAQQRGLEVARRSVDRLNALVEDLLEGARLEAGRQALRDDEVDLAKLAEDAVAAFRGPAKAAGVALDLRASAPLLLRGDPRRLGQVLDNLLDNAIKFTPSGGRILVAASRQGPSAVVQVQDTGAGLRAEDLPRLFQPFTQVHDTTTDARGTGLGLYISRGIVALHGGTLEASSDGPGRGSTFTLALPLAPVPRGPPPATGLRGRRGGTRPGAALAPKS